MTESSIFLNVIKPIWNIVCCLLIIVSFIPKPSYKIIHESQKLRIIFRNNDSLMVSSLKYYRTTLSCARWTNFENEPLSRFTPTYTHHHYPLPVFFLILFKQYFLRFMYDNRSSKHYRFPSIIFRYTVITIIFLCRVDPEIKFLPKRLFARIGHIIFGEGDTPCAYICIILYKCSQSRRRTKEGVLSPVLSMDWPYAVFDSVIYRIVLIKNNRSIHRIR